MSPSIGVIGDVHGNLAALSGLLRIVEGRSDLLVFVGDYVNRGTKSAEVLQLLIDRGKSGLRQVCIAGNHDLAFLRCIDNDKLPQFLQMGGAVTVNSYISRPEPDVLRQVQRVVPDEHKEFLRALPLSFEQNGLLVTHSRHEDFRARRNKYFHVYGHTTQDNLLPLITTTSAAIDTGCGTLPHGRLTCLLWPSLETVQVDSSGRKVDATQTS